MVELEQKNFRLVESLFAPFDYSLSIRAAIEGNNPGRIFVDDCNNPQTALALTVEGYLLCGDHTNPETNRAIKRLFEDLIFTGIVYINGDESMSLAVHPESWEMKLPELIPTHEVEKINRYHYLCRKLQYDWRVTIPEGYTVRRVDKEFLNDDRITFPEIVRDWMDIEDMWWTLENFLNKGISYAVLHNNEVVSWCTPDCVAGDRIDIGIFTHPDHRRLGLACIAVAATVEQCFHQGFKSVGWHCNADNTASWKTAEKVGYTRNREYAYYYYMYDPVDHLAELGWYFYKQGAYEKTVQYYAQVFELRKDNPDYYYHLTASAWAHLGNAQQALKNLDSAVRNGWRHAAHTKTREEFRILHDDPHWQEVIDEMEGN